MCEKAFRKHRLNFAILMKSEEMQRIAEHFGFKTVEDLIVSVGFGKTPPLQIIRKLAPKEETEKEPVSVLDRIISRMRKKKAAQGILVTGADDILIKYGKCCQPVPGDPITGYITQGYGITVHRTNCVNALKMNPERRVEVNWNTAVHQTYPVKVRIRSYDRFGLLADIAANISKNNANIIKAKSETLENKTVDIVFTLDVENVQHLKRVLAAIRKVKMVQDVQRVG